MLSARSSSVNREDLQRELRLALEETSERMRSAIKADLDEAVKDIMEAFKARNEPIFPREQSLSIVEGKNREIAMKAVDSSSQGSFNREWSCSSSTRDCNRDTYTRLGPDSGAELTSTPATLDGLDGTGFGGGKLGPKLMESLQATRENNQYVERSWQESLLRSPAFDLSVGILVVFNSVALGIDTETASANQGTVPSPWRQCSAILEAIFCILFASEWILRIYVQQASFFFGKHRLRNWCDTVVIVLQVYEQVCNMFGHRLPMIRVLRILRLMRVLNISHDLKTRVASIIESLSSLVSTMTLLLLLIYAFSVFFTQLAIQSPTQNHALVYWFGSLPRTALTLLETVAGGVSWDEPAMVVFDNMGIFGGMIYLFYVSFGVFVMLNVIMGVFIDKAIKIAEEQEEFDVACTISGAFVTEDLEGITRDVFNKKLEEQQLQECFKVLNIDMAQAPVLFDLIDQDKSGSVDAKEIVEGCLRLKGMAKALDVSIMEQAIFLLVDKVDRNVKAFDNHMKNVDRNLMKVGEKLGLDLHRLTSHKHHNSHNRGNPKTTSQI